MFNGAKAIQHKMLKNNNVKKMSDLEFDEFIKSIGANEEKKEINKDFTNTANTINDAYNSMVNDSVSTITNFYKTAKEYIKAHPDFKNKSRNDKIKVFYDSPYFSLFKSLSNSYPIIIQAILCDDLYHLEGVKEFVKLHINKLKNMKRNLTTDEKKDEWINTQALYYAIVWRRKYNNKDMKKFKSIIEQVRTSLKETSDRFEEDYEAAQRKAVNDKKEMSLSMINAVADAIENDPNFDISDEEKIKFYAIADKARHKNKFMPCLNMIVARNT